MGDRKGNRGKKESTRKKREKKIKGDGDHDVIGGYYISFTTSPHNNWYLYKKRGK